MPSLVVKHELLGIQASVVAQSELGSCGLPAVEWGPSYSMAREIFPDQGSNLHPWHPAGGFLSTVNLRGPLLHLLVIFAP